jgi:micrococcal nuclease
VPALLFVAAAVWLWSLASPPEAPVALARGRVSYVYDGDTFEVEGVGKVRIVGIDALDAHEERRTAEQAARYGLSAAQVGRWAERAAEFARERLAGREVVLHAGPERTDRYGRALAYLHRADGEGGDFGAAMLEAGLAAAYRRFGHPRQQDYLAAEAHARRRGAGMWSDAKVQP